jgi:S1-C subfamily serine protease
MKYPTLALLALAPLAAFRAVAEPPQPEPPRPRPPAIAAFEDEIIQIAEAARPSLVQIACHFRFGDQKDADFYVANEFSGVVYAVESGKVDVVTVGSAVRGARKVEVVLADSASYEAEVVGVDDVTNLAVVRFDPGDRKLRPAQIGDSDTLRPGNFVLAVGNPFGLKASLQHGIVSGVRRTVGGWTTAQTGLIQVTASINPGDGGGLLLNSRGEVVGILSSTFQRASAFEDYEDLLNEYLEGFDWKEFLKKARQPKEGEALVPKDLKELVERLMEERKKQLLKYRQKGGRISPQALGAEGINFAIPSNLMKRIVGDLRKTGKVERGYLGIRVVPMDPALRKHLGLEPGRGIVVMWVEEDSPGHKAGLQVHDVILSVDGRDVDEIGVLAEVVGARREGEEVPIQIVRQGETMDLKATLTKRKEGVR